MKNMHVREQLSAYLDDMLAADDAKSVQTHLQDCAECEKVFSELRSMVVWMKSIPKPALNIGLETRLIARLKEEQSKKDSFHFSWLSLSGGLATAMMALLVFVMVRENRLEVALKSESASGKSNLALKEAKESYDFTDKIVARDAIESRQLSAPAKSPLQLKLASAPPPAAELKAINVERANIQQSRAGDEIEITGDGFKSNAYLKIIRQRILSEWSQLAVYGASQTCVIGVTISKDGTMSNVKVEKRSHSAFYDQSSLRAIRNSSPWPPLPADTPKTYQRFRITFKQQVK